MFKYPSTNQFRSVVSSAKRANAGTLTFQGTVKLHGTNAAIVLNHSKLQFQSRERVLSLDDDNAGFMNYFHPAGRILKEAITSEFPDAGTVVVYGEWCGGSIQKGVALNQLEKMFVIFGVQVDGKWVPTDWKLPGTLNILHFPTWVITIDMQCPGAAQNALIDLTNAVEVECPVGAALGVSGIGEGIVWKCVTPGYESSDFWFKVKGEKHSVSKVKTLAAVDVEKIASIQAFSEMVVTNARLEQMMEDLTFDVSNLGTFIKRVHTDVVKEESDTIAANMLEPKEVGKAVSTASKKWFMEKMNAELN
jgi:hypothetical protein